MSEVLLNKGGTKQVTVLGRVVRQNAQSGARKPVLHIRDSHAEFHAHAALFQQGTTRPDLVAEYVYDQSDPMRCNVHVWFETNYGLMVRTSLDDVHQFEVLPADNYYRIFADVLVMKSNRDGTTNLPALVVRTNDSWDLKKVYEVRVRYPGTATVITLDNAGVLRTRLDLLLVRYEEEAA